MHILFLIRDLKYAGAQRQLVVLANNLSERGHQIDIIDFYPVEKIRYALAPEIFHLSLNKRGRWDVIAFFNRLRRVARERRPDIVYSFMITPNVVSALLKLVSSQCVVWGVRSSMNERPGGWVSSLNYWLESSLSNIPDLIITNSGSGRESLRSKRYPASKIKIVRNGFDLEKFYSDPSLGRKMRSKWGVSEDRRLIGLVGRIHPVKDPENFILAAQMVAKDHSEAHFVCIGMGAEDYLRELKGLVKRKGLSERFIWAGELDDMVAAYNALDVLCSSSYTEGFPNVIGEAMACGVPCVVTDVGDSGLIVGDTGCIVPPENPERLAGGISQILAGLDRVDRQRIRERIAENFGIGGLVENTEKILAGLLD